MIYFTSDTHLADPRVLRIDQRPFPGMREHDATLIANWNAVVRPDDEVWHLGDFMGRGAGDCNHMLQRLTGIKHLIIGNNDPDTVVACGGWKTVQHYKELIVDGVLLVMCHYPSAPGTRWARNRSISTVIHTAGSNLCPVSLMLGPMFLISSLSHSTISYHRAWNECQDDKCWMDKPGAAFLAKVLRDGGIARLLVAGRKRRARRERVISMQPVRGKARSRSFQ